MQKQNSISVRAGQVLTLVRILDIVFSPTNPRRRVNKQADEELRESIRQHGILQPPVCRPLKAPRLELVCGERRVRAALAIGLTWIDVVVKDLSTKQVREIQLVENAQREDLHSLDLAAGYAALIKHHGYDAKKVAEAVSKSIAHVYEHLKLLELEKTVRKAFLDPEHALTKGHAIEIARLQPADQRKALKEWTTYYQPSVPDLRGWIQREIHRRLDAVAFRKTDATLVPEAGACTNCPKRAGADPDRYPGVKPNTCMDRACYEAKLEAWIDAQPASVARISDDWSVRKQPKGVYGCQQFTQITGKKERCPSAQRGVVVAGHRRGAVIQVCVDAECKRHRSGEYKPSAAEAARIGKEKVETQIRRRTLDEIVARLPNLLGRRELVIIATGFLDFVHMREVCQQFDLLQEREEQPTYEEQSEAVIEHLHTLKTSELGRSLVEWVLRGWQQAPYSGPDHLAEIAQRYGVEIEQIRRQVVGEKKKKSGKPAKPDLQTSAQHPAETGSATATSAAV